MIDFDSRRAWRDYFAQILLAIILTPLYGLGLALFALIALDRYGTHYSIARDRIQARNGIISKNERSVRLENIRDLWLDQGVIQRLLGVGSIGFSTAGQGGSEVVFKGILKPRVLKERIEDHLFRKASA
jgi:uncharacterized membrane protein YdbT with pleckstrin-like domain